MNEIISIRGDEIIKTITYTETFSKKALEAELLDIENQLKELEKEPDEIMMPNDSKMMRRDELERRKEEIKSLMK